MAISNALRDELLALPPEDRTLLVDELTASLDTDEQRRIEAAQVREAEARYAAYRRGEMKTIPMDEVFRKLRAR